MIGEIVRLKDTRLHFFINEIRGHEEIIVPPSEILLFLGRLLRPPGIGPCRRVAVPEGIGEPKIPDTVELLPLGRGEPG